MNIDIHCHSSSKPSMRAPLLKKYLFQGFAFQPEWKLFRRSQRSIEKLTGVLQNTQAHFDSLYQGGIRVACISLTPMEKGFGVMNQKPEGFVKSILKDLLTKKKSDYLISPKPIGVITGYDESRINFVQDVMNDYYTELLVPEYEYIMKYENESSSINGKEYVVRFPKNAQELQRNLANDKNLNIILSIEGMHSLMRSPENFKLFSQQNNFDGDTSNLVDTDMQERFHVRINEMKSSWKARPFFVSLNHHFYNRLGGHAPSLGSDITLLVSQTEGMNTGLTTNGSMVIKELLKGPTPIYIDIKHMSPLCRKQYYELLQNDRTLRNNQNPKQFNYPIICSHTGISTIDKLQTMILNKNNEEAIQSDPNSFLYNSGINLCAEELKYILDSNGILGIQLDEKRISGKKTIKNLKPSYSNKVWLLYVKLIWANIFQGVRALNIKEAWDIFSIGSDYDGIINHLDEYPRSSKMDILRKDMLDFLNSNDKIVEMDFSLTRVEINQYLFGMSPELIVEKLFETNAKNFLMKWY